MAKRVELGDKDAYKKVTKNWKDSAYGKALYGVRKASSGFGSQEVFGRLHRAGAARGMSSSDFYDQYAEGKTGKDLTRWSKTVLDADFFGGVQPGEKQVQPEGPFGNFGQAFKKKKRRGTLLTGSQGLQNGPEVQRKTLLGH